VLTRRELAALALAAAAAPLIGCGGKDEHREEVGDEGWYDIGRVADVTDNWEERDFTAQGLAASVHVRRFRGEIVSLGNTCTCARKKQCPVRWVASTRRFICVCHGSVYGAQGRRLAGPAKGPLLELDVRVRGDRVQVALPILPFGDRS
jgi:cytochrome b6-f complex iron-sulfur subunit